MADHESLVVKECKHAKALFPGWPKQCLSSTVLASRTFIIQSKGPVRLKESGCTAFCAKGASNASTWHHFPARPTSYRRVLAKILPWRLRARNLVAQPHRQYLLQGSGHSSCCIAGINISLLSGQGMPKACKQQARKPGEVFTTLRLRSVAIYKTDTKKFSSAGLVFNQHQRLEPTVQQRAQSSSAPRPGKSSLDVGTGEKC